MKSYQDTFGLTGEGSSTGIIFIIYNCGQIAAFPFCGFLADGYGRRICIFVGCALVIVGTAIQTTAHHTPQFIGGRFILGFGASIASAAGPAYTVELAHPSYRGTMAGMYNNCKSHHIKYRRRRCHTVAATPACDHKIHYRNATDTLIVWWLGNIIAGWTTYGTDLNFPGSSWAWRVPTLIQCVLPGIVMSLVLFFPGKQTTYAYLPRMAYTNTDRNPPLAHHERQARGGHRCHGEIPR
jgi:MFS family permease